jgi:hypothetical protein
MQRAFVFGDTSKPPRPLSGVSIFENVAVIESFFVAAWKAYFQPSALALTALG